MAKTQSKKSNLTVIIDADSLLYEAASVNETKYDFGDNNVVTNIDEAGAKRGLKLAIESIIADTKADDYLMYITGSHNFRYDIYPQYKSNRKDVARPALLNTLKEYVLENFKCKMTTKIEADDACTIHMSSNPKGKILAHIDKDLNQVEGKHYNWRTKELYTVSYEDGQKLFYRQILSGDPVDGYCGCKGIGKVLAKKIIDENIEVLPEVYIKTRGKYKGQKELRFVEITSPLSVWDNIVSWYIKAEIMADPEGYKEHGVLARIAKIAEQKALVQARVARMLRSDEFKNGEIILWSPEMI